MFETEKYNKYLSIALWVFFAVLLCSYGYYIIEILKLGAYMPSRSDEVGYFLEAKGFAETWRLSPFVVQDEMKAPLFDFGPHGPMYPLLNGMVAKILGLRGLNFVLMNFVYLGLFFHFIWKSEYFNKLQKMTIFAIQYGYFICFMLSFSFAQEIIHLLFGGLLALNLIDLYKKHEDREDLDWKSIFFLVALLALFTSFRYGWVLFSAALIPLAKNRMDLLKLLGLSFVIVVVGQIYRKYFHASTDMTLLQNVPTHIMNGRFDEVFAEISKNISVNIDLFFHGVYKYANYYYSKIVFFGLTVYFSYLGIKNKDRLLGATGLMAFANLAALIVLYNAYDYRETRGLAAIFTIMMIIMVYRKLKVATVITLAYVILTFPFMFKEFNWLIFSKEVASTKLYLNKNMPDLSSFKNVKSNGKDLITVQFPEKMFWVPTPGKKNLSIKDILHTPLLTLPTKNKDGVNLRYTFSYYQNADPFRQRGKMPIDYVFVPGQGIFTNEQFHQARAKATELKNKQAK